MTETLDLYAIKREHGGIVYDRGRRWVGPGPSHSKRDGSLSLWLNADDRPVVHSFAGDSFGACLKHLGLEGREFTPADRAELARQRREREAETARRAAETRAFCRAVWEGCRPIEASPVETYLYGRGLILEGCADVRFHPAAPRSRKPGAAVHPAMLARVRDARGSPTGLHITYLTQRGRKAFGERSRLMFGQVAGGAVQLRPIGTEGLLGIAEGIETAASFDVLKGVPTWAALSSSGLQGFNLPSGVTRLLIGADADDGGAGIEAARTLARRVQNRCSVEIHSAGSGCDWNDHLRKGAR